MPDVARRAVRAAGLSTEDLDVFIPHQANVRIIDSMASRIGLSPEVVVAKDVVHNGNTSGASIPLAIEAVLGSGAARRGGTALLLGYGAGLSYAGLVVVLP